MLLNLLFPSPIGHYGIFDQVTNTLDLHRIVIDPDSLDHAPGIKLLARRAFILESTWIPRGQDLLYSMLLIIFDTCEG